MDRLLARSPFLTGVLLLGVGLFLSLYGQGWSYRGIPVPVFGGIFFSFGLFLFLRSTRGITRRNPAVELHPGAADAETSIEHRAMMFFFIKRKLEVDLKSRYVFVERTVFWIVRQVRAVPWTAIAQVEYSHQTMLGFDVFALALVLADGERVRLFEFTQQDPDEEGSEAEDRSRGLVELLRKGVERASDRRLA